MKIKNNECENSIKIKRPCEKKKTHTSWKNAIDHKVSLITKSTISIGVIEEYYGHSHEGWHVGHRRWEGKEPWQKLPKNMILRKTVS